MSKLEFKKGPDGSYSVEVSQRGPELLCNALLNKGTAFSREEREQFELTGLLPHRVASTAVQLERAYGNVCRKSSPLERYIGLAALQDRNEVLFYEVLAKHIDELMPIVYTPTVGEACKSFSQIFRRGRGLFITPDDRGNIAKILSCVTHKHTRLIVATDNERILGLGDQGAGGMGIPIGKLALYTMAAGLHPSETLPVSLDVGTDNEALLNDPVYVGWPGERLRGEAYFELIEEFVEAIMHVFPQALLQWEDFKKTNALNLLERYRRRLLCFNDDIQGTAAVALSGVMAACRKLERPLEAQRIVILGAGAAGIGIGHQLRDAIARSGLSGDALTRTVAVLDSRGLILDNRKIKDKYKQEFAWSSELAASYGLDPNQPIDLLQTVRALRPTVLIGTSGQPGAFSEEVIRAMADHTPNPAIFPFSNPTSKAEAVPEDLMKWTDGTALVATGSPFDPVVYKGKRTRVGQGNNVYIFPGVGLGALAAEAREVTDSMFTVAAQTLAGHVDQRDLDKGALFPPLTELREITRKIAIAVVKEAREQGVGRGLDDAAIPAAVDALVWEPHYPKLIPV